MPIRAEVEGVGTLEFPDGTDPAVIQKTVQRAVRLRAMYPAGDVPPEWGRTKGLARGARDVVDTGAQLAVRGANAIGLAPDSEVQRVEQINKDAEQQYQQGRGETGFDAYRAAGNAIIGALASPIRATQAGSLAVRTARAAGNGSFAGLVSGPINDAGDNWDYTKKAGTKAAIGGVVGAVAQPVMELGVEGAGRGLQYLANRAAGGARALAGEAGDAAAERIVRETLGRQGMDFNALGEQVRQTLIDDVRTAMRRYGGVSAAAIGRRADFDQLGVEPRQSWITRDPNQWGREENLAGINGVGEPLVNMRNQLDRTIIGRLNEIRGAPSEPFTTGQRAEAALRRDNAQSRGDTNVLYRTFQEVAPNTTGNPQRFANDVFGGLEGQMAGASLPPGLRDVVNRISAGEIPLTPSTLMQLQKMANAARGADGSTNYALGHLSRAIDRELDSVSGPAADVLRMARGRHAEGQRDLEAIPALRAVTEGTYAPEQFVKRFVVGGDVREVAAMWAKLDEPAREATRSTVIETLKNKAISNASDDAGVVSQKAISDFLELPGMRQKLRIIVGERGVADLERIQRVAESAIKVPGGAKPNTSSTSQAIANLLMRTTGVPVLGPMVTQPLQRLGQEAGVRGAQRAGADALGQGQQWTEELARRSQALAGLLGYGGTAGLLGDLSR